MSKTELPGGILPKDRVRRKDGDLILTGQGGYIDDFELPGMLHAAILRSPHAHARIVGIDPGRARSMRGVRAVLTGQEALELAGPLYSIITPANLGGKTADIRCLAYDKVRYVGEPVAAVVAESVALAEAALQEIEVRYELLPPVIEISDALRSDAPLVYEDWGDNVVASLRFVEGETDRVMAEAEHVIEDELRIQRYQTAPMETRGYIGWWQPGGRITMYASTQNPHVLRTGLAKIFKMPENRIRVIQPRVGGSFGSKFFGFHEEPLVCLLSRLAGAPVKWIETRAESLIAGAREFEHRFKVGFDNDGKILAIQNRIRGNVGAMSCWGGWGMTIPAGMFLPGPYKVKHYDVETVAVVTNKAPWAGARGFGKESATLALERMADLIAERLNLDPAEVRRRNFIPPDEFPYWTKSMHIDTGRYAEALDMVLELGNYKDWRLRQEEARKQGRLVGIGVSFELTPEGGDFAGEMARGFDNSTVRINPSGTVTVLTGVTSPGTGNETSIGYLVARELGISVDKVEVVQGDTDITPYGYGNWSSRSLTAGGAAAVLAARDVKQKLAAAAAVLLNTGQDKLVFADDKIRAGAAEDQALSFEHVVEQIYHRGYVEPGFEPPLESTRMGQPGNIYHHFDEHGRFSPYPSYPYASHMCVVEIDRETGEVDLIDYSAIGDCGTIINRTFVDGQLRGAVAMGIGGALYEESPYTPDGQPLAHTFKAYLTPRAPDLPSFKTDHMETPSPYNMFGMKGAGESGLGGAVACIANAVNDALRPLGVKIHNMPLNPPHILEAIHSEVKS